MNTKHKKQKTSRNHKTTKEEVEMNGSGPQSKTQNSSSNRTTTTTSPTPKPHHIARYASVDPAQTATDWAHKNKAKDRNTTAKPNADDRRQHEHQHHTQTLPLTAKLTATTSAFLWTLNRNYHPRNRRRSLQQLQLPCFQKAVSIMYTWRIWYQVFNVTIPFLLPKKFPYSIRVMFPQTRAKKNPYTQNKVICSPNASTVTADTINTIKSKLTAVMIRSHDGSKRSRILIILWKLFKFPFLIPPTNISLLDHSSTINSTSTSSRTLLQHAKNSKAVLNMNIYVHRTVRTPDAPRSFRFRAWPLSWTYCGNIQNAPQDESYAPSPGSPRQVITIGGQSPKTGQTTDSSSSDANMGHGKAEGRRCV